MFPSSGFAEELLELEDQLADHESLDTLTKLLAMYSAAIEFYEAQRDQRYKAYQKRLANTLQAKAHLFGARPKESDLGFQRKADSLVKDHDSMSAEASRSARLSLESQTANLQQRLLSRQSFRLASTAEKWSDSTDSESVYDDYGKELERVLQQVFTQRQEQETSIKVRYSIEKEDLESAGCGDLLGLVFSEMDKRMQAELAEVSQQIAQQKHLGAI